MSKPKAPSKRIYHVAEVGGDGKFLVRAATQAQARGHVVRNCYTVSIPSQDELVNLAKAGVEVEEAVEVQS